MSKKKPEKKRLTNKLNPREIIPENIALPPDLKVELGLENSAPPTKLGQFDPVTQKIKLRTDADAQVYGHELGHAIWDNLPFHSSSAPDATIGQKLRDSLFESEDKSGAPGIYRFMDLLRPYEEGIPFPSAKSAYGMAVGGDIGKEPITRYRFEGAPHIMPDFIGQYIGEPELLKRRHPEIYKALMKLFRMEYSRNLR